MRGSQPSWSLGEGPRHPRVCPQVCEAVPGLPQNSPFGLPARGGVVGDEGDSRACWEVEAAWGASSSFLTLVPRRCPRWFGCRSRGTATAFRC